MRKPTFPLRMDDGTEARSLEELKEHFSLPKVLDYLKMERSLHGCGTGT
ncbi:hypothetical protein [Ruminococcus sp. AM42-11]|nr:hypothetical protein [Ruminococcus sp. AM42-11]